MVLLFIGPSGSGKDTQAQLLNDSHGYEIISSGQLLRDISEGDSLIQMSIRNAMNNAKWDELNQLLYDLLQVCFEHSTLKDFILTGFVRTVDQVQRLDKALSQINTKIDKVIYFDLNDENALKRMEGRMVDKRNGKIYHAVFNPPPADAIPYLQKRPDDADTESYLKRLRQFHRDNEIILGEYEKRGILIRVDGSKSIEEVHAELIKDVHN